MIPIWSILTIATICTPAFARIRKVEVPQDKIVTVRTALGIATIIQVPAPPTSLVVGDSSAFKVEYLDQAITIKPLRANAKSNLYVYTDWRRFNVQLVTGGEGAADYVVYLQEPIPKSKAQSLRWTSMNRILRGEGLSLAAHRAAHSRDGRLLVEFSVNATKTVQFEPRWIWITQRGKARPIQSLFLSTLALSPGNTATGTLELLASEIDPGEPLRLELRDRKTAALLLPKVSTWK